MTTKPGRPLRCRLLAPAKLACTFTLLVSLSTGVADAQAATEPRLTAIEQKIRDYVRAHESEQIGFLEKAVNINSGTFNLAGVRQVGRLFAPEFAAIGFDTTWVTLPDAVGRAGHFFAERKGNRGKRILLIGHLDTVFEGDGEKFVRLDTLAAGAGSSDMKGGDVVILYALKALQSVGALKGTRIIVAMTGDEEDAGALDRVSRQPLIDAAKRSDVALAFEEDAGKGTVARRGFSGWQLTVSARQAHSSGIFQPGSSDGAIYEAARILNAFRERLSGEQYLSFNPAIVVGGTDVTYDSTKIAGTTAGKDNIIAPKAYARGDLRFISDEQLQRARNAMRAIVAEHLPGTTASITFEDGNPAMPPTKGNLALLAVEDSVSRALGQGPVEALDPGRRGGGDISYVSQYLDALDGLGVKGMRSHTPDERVDLRSIVPATERAAILIYRLTRR
ncbi:MAG TPA: M20/M25/M40 family metallo-hydrolase [Gemmatimonadaceae bacterium]|nr:M20/M25/M40 family metallo-hydrolase [Gemmatimonadaceae bacterium]